MSPRLAEQSSGRRAEIRARLATTTRGQVTDLLIPEDAQALSQAASEAPYNVVTRRGSGHVDLPAAWLASLTPPQKSGFGEVIQASARTEFQYLYDNHPIYDLAQIGQGGSVWAGLVAFLNGASFLDLMRDLTGDDEIVMADAQLTRFRPGHFLTRHDDHADGKGRRFAYVLGLSPAWSTDWGGLLAFHSPDGNVSEAFTPRFNTLNLLKTPQPHSVTQVALNAGGDRLSVTGWLRASRD